MSVLRDMAIRNIVMPEKEEEAYAGEIGFNKIIE